MHTKFWLQIFMGRGKLWDSGIDGKAIFIISKVFVPIVDAHDQYRAKHSTLSGVYLTHVGLFTVSGPRYESRIGQKRTGVLPTQAQYSVIGETSDIPLIMAMINLDSFMGRIKTEFTWYGGH
jgi:hypothetical protein